MSKKKLWQPLSIFSDLEAAVCLEQTQDELPDPRWSDGALLHQLFEAQAENRSHAVALTCAHEQITYGELNKRTNQLAHYLRKRGAGPESMVGIYMERSIELVVAILGVLKVGGAYLPLDPSYPKERLTFMLQDVKACIVLTQSSLVAQLPELAAQVILLDTEWKDISREPAESVAVALAPDNAAYVIYTSGSTGLPKGVLVTHANVVRLFRSTAEHFHFHNEDVWTLFHSYAFDFSVWELWGALIYGGRLVVVPYLLSRSPASFYILLCRERVTVLNQTPSAFRQLIDMDERGSRKSSLRLIIFGGEALDPQSLAPWFARHGDQSTRLVNMYGITETTVHVTYYALSAIDSREPAGLKVGTPIRDLEVYILDDYLQPAPPGVSGEMHIGGAGLARGYFNCPALTAERFIPDPFSAKPGARLYRSGDHACCLPDGQLEYRGRRDQQVKLRGYRIELGEIEVVLGRHEQVSASVVLLREDSPGDQRLVAYVVGAGEGEPAIAELRRYLQQQLPEYMVPQTLVLMAELPLTPSGKVDRGALPAPAQSRTVTSSYQAPRNKVEEELARIWQKVLQVERVGVEDNFFELGGHSLLATQLTCRIRDVFRVDVPLHMLFDAPRPAELAVVIAQLQAEQVNEDEDATPLLEIVSAPEDKHLPFPLSDQQRAYWIGRGDSFELGNVACHIYFDFACSGLDLARLNAAWQVLIQRHDMLRAIVLEDGQQQILEDVPPYLIEIVDLRGHEPQVVDAQLQQVREEMSHRVLAPAQWPLFEIKAHLLDGERLRLHVNFDLLIVDGVSLTILFKEWERLYHDSDAVLDPLELSFRDYVLADIAAKDSTRYQKARQYWLGRLATLPPGPELPLAKSPAAVLKPRFSRQNTTLDPRTHQTMLDAETWSRLKSRGRDRGLTPSVILCTAYAEVLGRWSQSPCFTINVTAFGRLPVHPQINRVVGDFTTLTLLEVDNLAHDTFESRAQRLQQQLWQDLEHRHFNGLRVMQELARRQGAVGSVSMPVVFTSLLEDFSVTDWLGTVAFSLTNTPQVWLDNVAMERDGALAFHWDAVTELFPEGLLHDMFEAYWQLLRRLADDEQSWILREPIQLPPAQLAQIAASNQTETPVPSTLLHDGFCAQVKLRPQQTAVITRNRNLTYEELARRAERVSRWLRRRGAERNRLVGVVMEKGWEQIVAVLGILQSGAAYLPLDAELPQERLCYLLDNGEVELVLTQSWIDGRLNWPQHIERLQIDAAEAELDGPGPVPEPQQAAPTDLAYVIYTSGSTGLPKGVMIEHQSALNTIVDINKRFGIGPTDRVLALSALNFDLSVYDIFGMLNSGGGIVIPDAADMREPRTWAELIERERVTIWQSVPALLRLMVDEVKATDQQTLSSLRLVLMSGDWIPITLPQLLKLVAPSAKAISLGGPTETTIWNISYPIESIDPLWKSIPYGKPLSNSRFYILNSTMDDCPVWVTGEMYCAGIGLARGYWRDEQQTKAKFLTDERRAERLYRTGDLGRYLPDGNIEFIGRSDFQVKVQGNRIELGEIEAALKQHQMVGDAVVTVCGPHDGDRRLVSYVVPKPEAPPPSTAELRDYLSRKLPLYMVPSVFVMLKELPLTPNGKVNRRALQEPNTTTNLSVVPSRAETADPSLLARIASTTAEILKIERVDPDVKLLNLGAASIDIMRLGGTLQQKFGFRPQMGQLFRLPTVRAIAEYYESCLQKQSSAGTTLSGRVDEETRADAVLAATSLLFDPEQREKFKASRPGWRQLTTQTSWIDLGLVEPDEVLTKCYRRRRSHRNFSSQAVRLEELAGLLNCLAEISLDEQPKYRYGSAGGLYPVQTYLYISEQRVQGVPVGLYYYHPLKRQLALIAESVRLDRSMHFHYNRPIFDEAAFTIFLVAQLNAITPMYGKSSLKYVLLEAGAMTQLLEVTGPDHGLGLCQVGEVEFEEVRKLLGLEESQVLLHTLLGGKDAAISPPTISPDRARRHEAFPLLDIQQAIWIGRNADYALGNVSTHVYYEFESTELDLERLTRAWQSLIERHDMLRAIVMSNGQQRILPDVPRYQIEVVDMRGQEPQIVEAQLQQTRERMSHQVLQPDKWPLFENLAHLLDEGWVRLHTSIDSQFVDALSENIIFSELSDFYSNPDLILPPLELSFQDCVLEEVALRASETYRKSREYWLARIPTLPPAPQLPLTQNPNSLKYPKFVRYDAVLGVEQWERLKSLCGQAGLTPSIVICAVFASVLATWSKSQHLTLNLTLYNRPPLHPQINDIVGQFTGVNLLEVDCSRTSSFTELARQLQDQLWDNLEHRYFNGVEVLRELARFQGMAPQAMMPVVFTSMLNQPARRKSGTPLRWLGELEYSISQAPQVWIENDTSERDGTLSFYWDCVEDLFPPGLLSDMFGAYCGLLERLAAEPDAWQGSVPLPLPPAQLQQRAAANKTDAPIPNELLHTLFAAQVDKHGDHPAVITSRRTLSYQELHCRSNQTAHWLRHLGARPNTLVAVVMEKGWEQIVAVLGILQSGAAYVPLDPQLPGERLRCLLEASQAKLVLTKPSLDAKIDWPESVHRLCIDDERLDGWSSQSLDVTQNADDLAFVIYTSGSTGLPKGVMISHRGAVNTIVHTNARFAVGPEDRVLALTALNHDMSSFDIFGLLSAGGAIVMPEAAERRNPAHWADLMSRERVTIWNSVPAMMKMLLDYQEERALAFSGALRLAFLGGDWIPLDMPARIRTLAESVQVISVGGPTETTIWNICYPVESIDPSWKSIPYGKPLANSRYYILNDALADCPVWVAGELYCAGAGVAQGYWRDEEQTRASFFEDPRTGERLYRTGDLGRYLPDGNIEFLGRADSQVKVQGNRVELGEIEAALKQHEQVSEAVVAAEGELRGEKRLIAFYTPRKGGKPSAQELRGFLKEKLPLYMIPSLFVQLKELSLTPNGKVDRRALLTRAQPRVDPEKAFVAPRNPVERQVTRICAEVLKCKVGIFDDFFALGGNSLTAMQLISKLRTECDVEVPLVELFDNPTMAHLAETIMEEQFKAAEPEHVAQLLAELDQLSEDQVERLLHEADRSADHAT